MGIGTKWKLLMNVIMLYAYTQKTALLLKKCSPVQNGQCEKSCQIKGGGQEMAVMVQVDGKKFNNNNLGC